ncbi:MAG: DUF3015 family protein [Bacteriovoracaceae bacterium]
MKKILGFVALSTLSVSAFAGYGAAGCGLGSLVFQDKGAVQQVLAATTNGTSGSQTFGITTGTSNCDSPNGMKSSKIESFVEANMVAVNNDIAKGSGDTIASISNVYGCNDSKKVGATLQKNYKSIFPSNAASAKDVSANLESVMRADLASTCTASLK